MAQSLHQLESGRHTILPEGVYELAYISKSSANNLVCQEANWESNERSFRLCGPRFDYLAEAGGVGGGGLLIAGAGESSGHNQAAPPTPRSWDYTPAATTTSSRQSEGLLSNFMTLC
jgi:hypothetical protein